MYLNSRSELSIPVKDNINNSSIGLQVICAWPVSGQYGAGTRIAYYILIVTATFLRNAEKLQEAALAAVLIFPAVAGIHGVVLAAVHVDGAVDLDVFAVLQLCAIGIISNNFTRSTRFPKHRGWRAERNISIILIGIMSAGLCAITVELFRVSSIRCTYDDEGRILSRYMKDFPYEHAACGLQCMTEIRPVSAIRHGTAEELFVVPAPQRLQPSAGIIISTGCCIYSFIRLSPLLVDVFVSVRKIFLVGSSIEGDITNNSGILLRPAEIRGIDHTVRRFLSVIEYPVCISLCLALIVVGELNFFSPQMTYQTDSFAAIGQWGPVVGIVLGILGPLYIVLSTQRKTQNSEEKGGSAFKYPPTTQPEYDSVPKAAAIVAQRRHSF